MILGDERRGETRLDVEVWAVDCSTAVPSDLNHRPLTDPSSANHVGSVVSQGHGTQLGFAFTCVLEMDC